MEARELIGRSQRMFASDVENHAYDIDQIVNGSRILVIGGAGSIGREVVTQLFQRRPASLHVIDVSENSLVELVRGLRSAYDGGDIDTRFLPLDIGSLEARAFLSAQDGYDLILNFSALKHVRSEKDAYSLMRMVDVNVVQTLETLNYARSVSTKKYFAVSTDKAQSPANLMGATKRIMEDVIFGPTGGTDVSTARFANVAFSDGSLLHGFRQRLLLRQPISAPYDIKRYFVTGEEAGLLCLASVAMGGNREIFFPKLNADLDLLTFADIAKRFLLAHGYEAVVVNDEDEARRRAKDLIDEGKWPCHFFASNTSGEKPFEEFHGPSDAVTWARFADIGVVSREEPDLLVYERTETFLSAIHSLRAKGTWDKAALVNLIKSACPDLVHVDTGRTLDNRM